MNNLALSNRHQVFVEMLVEGNAILESGEKAGFALPGRDAAPLTMERNVQAYIKRRIRGKLLCNGAPTSYQYLINLLNGERATIGQKIEIAKFLLTISGYVAPKAEEQPSEMDKQPTEMTDEELRQSIEQGEAELAARATPILQTAAQSLDSLM